MMIVILFLALMGGAIGAWLATQRLASKPWLEHGTMEECAGAGAVRTSPGSLALSVLVAVIGCLFALLFSAYLMRSDSIDWTPPPLPAALWVNTAILAWSSIALQVASNAARQENDAAALAALGIGVASAVAFLVAQTALLLQMSEAGQLGVNNPASAFFWLVITIHGIHLLGGMIALGATAVRIRRSTHPQAARATLGLCAWYWHFLLVVWLIFVWLLNDGATAFAQICRQLIPEALFP